MGNFGDINWTCRGHSWEKSRTLLGKPMTLMGNTEDINGELRGHYWEKSRPLMGKIDDITRTFRGH